MDINEYKQEVLDDMNNCISPCADIESVGFSKGVPHDTEWLVSHLPALEYVKNRMINYMFSNGLAAGSDEENARLDNWLYGVKNPLGATNYSVLQNAIGEAAVYGEVGLRLMNNSLYTYHKGHYGILYRSEDGFKEVVAFFIRKDEDLIDEDFEIKNEEWNLIQTYEDVQRWFTDRGLILLDPSEFVNLRNDTTDMHGDSPFQVDRLRLDLLVSVYQRLNYDINYDGPGRIIVRPKAGFTGDEDNETSTSTIIVNNNDEAQRKRYNEALKEVRRVSNEIKNSSSDSVIALSNGFSDKIEHLPRVTKATEFFGWLEEEVVIIAQMLDMAPVLVGVGKWSGNVSMSAIIDNDIVNTIVPMREKYAVQFSNLIGGHLGLPKVYFNKYDLKQMDDENASRSKLAMAARDLCYASKSLVSDENATEDAKAASRSLNQLIINLSDMLNTSLFDDYGNLKSLN